MKGECHHAPSDAARQAVAFANANRAASTEWAYLNDFNHFTVWATERGMESLPALPETVVLYLTDPARTHSPATITRRLASISVMHRRQGLDTPTSSPAVREVMKGIRRELKVAQREAAPATIGEIRRMVAHLPADRLGLRGKPLLLVGFAGALRRSELAAVAVEDLQDRPEGLVITLRTSKTDQEGQGRQVAIPRGRDKTTCPVTALQHWLAEAAIDSGPAFRAVDRHGNVSGQALGLSETIRSSAPAVCLLPG